MDNKFEEALKLIEKNKVNEAGEILLELASKGHIKSATKLGGLYFNNVIYAGLTGDIRGNLDEAVKWWKFASDNGDKDAISSLATMYLLGTGVSQNTEIAIKLFNSLGAGGLEGLALMYKLGKGVEENPNIAFELYLESYKRSANEVGIDNCILIILQAKDINPSWWNQINITLKEYPINIRKPDMASTFGHLGQFYSSEKNPFKDYKQALYWYKLSVKKGYKFYKRSIKDLKQKLKK